LLSSVSGRTSGTFGTLFFGGGGASVAGMLDVRTTGSARQKNKLFLRQL